MSLNVMDTDLNMLAQAECCGLLSSTHLLQQFCQSQELLWNKPRKKIQKNNNKNKHHSLKHKQSRKKKGSIVSFEV